MDQLIAKSFSEIRRVNKPLNLIQDGGYQMQKLSYEDSGKSIFMFVCLRVQRLESSVDKYFLKEIGSFILMKN